MAAYVILDVQVTDPERYAEYVPQAGPTVERFGGRYLVRGGETRVLEGAWDPHRVVVLEFESFERAQAWWDSKEYAGPKALRQSAAVSKVLLVRGT